MTLSKTSVQAVDLDDLERQMRDVAIPKRSDDRLAELARIVGRNLGGIVGGREQAASAAPVQPAVRDGSFDEDEPHAEYGSAQDSDGSVDQSFDGDDVERVPDTSDTALAQRALKMRSLRSPRALALVVPFLLVTIGVGAAVVMRARPMDGLGSKAPVIKADDAPLQQAKIAEGDQALSQSALEAAGSSGKSDQLVVAAPSVSPPDLLQTAPGSSVFGTPHRVSTVSVKPDVTIVSKGKPEAAPLPPTKPRTLASAATTALVRVANMTSSVTPAATKGAEATRAKPSDASANAAGPLSFSIQLASSVSKSEALATLSRLRKQYPDKLGGGSVSRVDAGSNGVFYRVRGRPISRDAADKVCSQLKASGENCIVTRS
ncbi:Sporulation related domain-containing protein [Rhizobiales bacterium GAS191]|nr:Sporulation related domain-containing protein [Rhizobiales bacterium GAS188]SEE41991.1 Sporulation related domain-containing protein [Rhizobiales bacterium GAS191]